MANITIGTKDYVKLKADKAKHKRSLYLILSSNIIPLTNIEKNLLKILEHDDVIIELINNL